VNSYTPLGFEDELAPDVWGYTVDCGDKGLYVPLVSTTKPGEGRVGLYIDSLPRDRRVVFPNVLSPILKGMLIRRGFTLTREFAEEFNDFVPCWERKPVVDLMAALEASLKKEKS